MAAPGWLTARPIAHRGLHDAAAGLIENTVSAALAAIDAGCAIECDVQLTADGEAVVFHDFTLERLTRGEGRVDAMTALQLADLAMQVSADRIPTLDRFIGLIAGRVPLVVEIKSRFDGDLRLAARTAAVVANYPDHPIALKSFDPQVVAALRQLAPARCRGIVAMSHYAHRDYAHLTRDETFAMANLLHYPHSQPDFLSWAVRDLPSVPFLWRQALGRPVMTWTVRTPEDRQAATAHADQMVFEGFRP